MSHPKLSLPGIIGALLVVADAVRLLLEWRLVRWGLEMANLGGAVDFALTHWQEPGWLASPLVQILIIAVGFALIFWDRQRPSWLPSPELSPHRMIVGGLIIIAIGAVLVGIGYWRLTESKPSSAINESSAKATSRAVEPQQHRNVSSKTYTQSDRDRLGTALYELSQIINNNGDDIVTKTDRLVTDLQMQGIMVMKTGRLSISRDRLNPGDNDLLVKLGDLRASADEFNNLIYKEDSGLLRKYRIYNEELEAILHQDRTQNTLSALKKDIDGAMDVINLSLNNPTEIGNRQPLLSILDRQRTSLAEKSFAFHDWLNGCKQRINDFRHSPSFGATQ